jgi:hypothetical protein
MYMKGMVLALQMTDVLLAVTPALRFAGGGNGTHWPYGGDWVIYKNATDGSVFVPAVLPPPHGSSKTAPTSLAVCDILVKLLRVCIISF